MYRTGLEDTEIEELRNRVKTHARSTKERFLLFTDVLIEYVGSGEWKNRSARYT